MPSFESIFTYADIFGQPIKMSFSRHEKIRTPFGGLISIIFCAVSVAVIYLGSQNLIFKQNPKVIVNDAFAENPRQMTLSEQNFPIAFSLQAPDTLGSIPILDSTIFNIELVYSKITRTKTGAGTTKVSSSTETPLKLEKCTLAHFGSMAASFTHFDLTKMLCIAKNQPNADKIQIQGNFDSVYSYDSLVVRVVECDSSNPANGCVSDTDKTKYLNGAWFNVIYTNMVVDSNNYENPNSRFRDMFFTMINRKNYVYVNLGLEHVNVTTDSGWLLESLDTKSYIKVNDAMVSTQLSAYPGNVLISCSIEVSKLESVYYRSYDKLQNIFADMGSLISAAFIVVFFILEPYTKLKIREALMNELFHIYQTPKSHEKEGNERDQGKTVNEDNRKGGQNEQETYLLNGKTTFSINGMTPTSNYYTETSATPSVRRNFGITPKGANESKDSNKQQSLFATDVSGLTTSRDKLTPPRKTVNTNVKTPAKRKIIPNVVNLSSPVEVQPLTDNGDSPVKGSRTGKNNDNVKLQFAKERNVQVRISFLEYVMSFIYRPQKLRKKMELLEQGIRNINERLDVINIMKKLREVDKLKVLLLDDKQCTLFNHFPKPEIRPIEQRYSIEQLAGLGLITSLKFVAGEQTEDLIVDSYDQIRMKPQMSEIDRKLIEIFEKKNKMFLK